MQITAVSKLKHAALWKAVKSLGSQAALARAVGVRQQDLCKWINLRGCPAEGMDDDKKALLDAKFVEVTGFGLDELFPSELRRAEDFLRSNKTIERTATVAESALLRYATDTRDRLLDYSNPPDAPELSELREELSKSVASLSYREMEILNLRYGLNGESYTLDEVGEIFKVGRERIRQIESKAIRKLQQPRMAKKLSPHLGQQGGTCARCKKRFINESACKLHEEDCGA